MKLKEFKFDRGWKLLLYFDLVLPAVLYFIAWATKLPQLSNIFHAYEIFLVNPIPNISALTGILGLVFHLGVIGYTMMKRNFKDLAFCIAITLLITLFFLFEINYLIIKPLEFSTL